METEYKQPNNVWHVLIRVAAFLLVSVMLLSVCGGVLNNPEDVRASGNIGGFYDLPENSLDAVYIGSSRVYAFFMPAVAFERSGICVWNYASPAQPIDAARELVEEVLKTQPDALILINLDDIRMDSREFIHYLTDYMPFSKLKVRLIYKLIKKNAFGLSNGMEYYFPMLRYHSRWQELTETDFGTPDDRATYMSSSAYGPFLYNARDFSGRFLYADGTEKVREPDAYMKGVLDEIIGYRAERKARLLFTVTPQVISNRKKYGEQAGVCAYVKSKGAEVLNMQEVAAEIGLDPAHDFYNAQHTNVHGAMKVTAYLTDYLTEHYGFTDKRGDKAYEKWTEAAERYDEKLASALLPFERAPRADLPAVELSLELLKEGGVSIAFTPVEDADGYAVFRKKDVGAPWEPLGDCKENTFADTEGNQDCIYAVAAYTESDAGRLYGMPDYADIEVY